jgi:uncharacterized glyoxalase superfamily protein PhnB
MRQRRLSICTGLVRRLWRGAGQLPERGGAGPKSLKGSPVTIHLYVENVDATVARAVAAGAKVTMPVEDQFWGDRFAMLEDPFGHKWSVATHIHDLSTEEIQQAMATMGT